MFERLPASAPDPILGLNEAFQADQRPQRVNLTVGVYIDETGVTPILPSVKLAERQLVDTEPTKTYFNIVGHPKFCQLVTNLVFGDQHTALVSDRVATLQAPGGTGALRVAADFVAKHFPESQVWVSDPTWGNHPAVFEAAGVATKKCPYYDRNANRVDLEAMVSALDQAPAGDFVIFHGCCHNPTGADLDAHAWEQVAELCKRRKLIPIVDLAYQGLGHDLERDASGVRWLTSALDEAIVCVSFSKTFGLYRERTGAMSLIGRSPEETQLAVDAIKICVRRNYSNPPSHGASIVATILSDPELKQKWEHELAEMAGNIQSKRQTFADALQHAGWPDNVDFLRQQIGMFSLIGLSPQAVDRLREERSVYLVRNGRLNLAGIRPENMDYVVESLLAVRS